MGKDNKKCNQANSCNNSACHRPSLLQSVKNLLLFVPRLLVKGFQWLLSFFVSPDKYAILFHELNAHGVYTFVAVVSAIICVKMFELVSQTWNLTVAWPWLFHTFHYAHTFFASTTATLVSMRFSKNI